MKSDTSHTDRPLREQYFAERIERITGIIKYCAPLYILIVGGFFIYSDLFVSDFPWAPKWRLPSLIFAGISFILVYIKIRNKQQLFYLSYLAFLFGISLMMAGITWEVAGNLELDRAMNGVLLAVFAVYIGVTGGAKILALVYLPLIILPVIILANPAVTLHDFILYANPLALMVSCLVLAQVDENLRFREFKNRKIAENERVKTDKAFDELRATQSQLIHAEKLASLGQLTAGIAHEIKNPLNFVNNFSELSVELIEEANEELLSEKAKRKSEKGDAAHLDEALEILSDIELNLKKIHQHGSRADSIVKSMLQHSRGGSGEMQPTDLNTLVKEYVNLAFHGMRAGKDPINVDMDLELDEEVDEVPLIAEDFSRVIINLCNNAFDALKEKASAFDLQTPDNPVGAIHELPLRDSDYHPKLTVQTYRKDDVVTIEIEDNGPGIPVDIQDKIMQPFFTTKKGTEGTGLGLSITHDIVKAHGGTLTIESNPAQGSIFKITLPC